MVLNLNFINGYTRSEIRTFLANRGDNLPSGAITTVVYTGNIVDVDETVFNSENDIITQVKIDGFSDIYELATFLNSLPVSINDRLYDMNYF